MLKLLAKNSLPTVSSRWNTAPMPAAEFTYRSPQYGTSASGRVSLKMFTGSNGPVYDVAQLVNDPHVRQRRSFVEVESPDGEGPVLQLMPAPRLSRTPGRVRHAGLRAGARTAEVLLELGYSAAAIDELSASGAVGSRRAELAPA